jgi:hypothetical protein
MHIAEPDEAYQLYLFWSKQHTIWCAEVSDCRTMVRCAPGH